VALLAHRLPRPRRAVLARRLGPARNAGSPPSAPPASWSTSSTGSS
jgi:hypothetical protein